MTPGLAGFVASSDAADGWDDAVAAIMATLGQGFTVVREDRVPETPTMLMAPRRRTWLDTFDWRLYRSGLLLEYIPLHRGGELRLTALPAAAATPTTTLVAATPRPTPSSTPGAGMRAASAGLVIAVQPVAGWRSSRAHLAADLPAGPVADRVAGLIAPRALQSVVSVTTTVAVSRLLNEDAKTVARLLVERPALVATAGMPTVPKLAPRISVLAVRGYPGQARRAARIVSESGGAALGTGTLLDEALAALGRTPADYSNKVNAKITGGMASAQAVAIILLRLLDMAEVNAPGVVKDIDTEFLHDFRVAVRRTRAALKLLGGALSLPGGTAGFAREFKWLGDVTTPTRDLDVHLLGFEDMVKSLKAAKPDDLEPFRAYLTERRATAFRALSRALRSQRFRDLMREWRATLTPISEGKAVGGRKRTGMRISAATLAAESTRRAFVKVARMGGAITPDSPHESLHDLRKRCKELRYALEFFAPLHTPSAYARVVGDLKRLQDCLGIFQDDEVQIAEIRSLATAMLAAHEAPAVTLLAMGEITAGLAAGQAAARADFERRFADFAGIDGQRRMSALLRGKSPLPGAAE